MSAAVPEPSRLVFLDALRGLAALAVVLFHLGWMTPLREPLHAALGDWGSWPLRQGYAGVAIFFVLSGAVIAHSLLDADVTLRFFGRFALRRSVRLDPPYWCAIALAVACIAAGHLLGVSSTPAMPSATVVAAHAMYLQGVLGMPQLVSQFWTLPFEFQFYLAFCALLGMERTLCHRLRSRAIAAFVAHAPLAMLSLVLVAGGVTLQGWFLREWHAFMLGVLVTWSRAGRVPGIVMLMNVGAVAALSALHASSWLLVEALTATLLALAGGRGLSRWTCGNVLQWLGRISYSLYLTHFVAGVAVRQLAARCDASFPVSLAILGTGVALSLAIGAAFHRLIEAPSHRLARSERLTPRALRLGRLPPPIRPTSGVSSRPDAAGTTVAAS